jgi:phosphatidylinositol phospholipase C delta
MLCARRINYLIALYSTCQQVEIHNQEEDEATVVPEYRKIIAIHAGKPKGGLEDCLDLTNKTVRRLSLSEQELESATKTHGTAIVR